MKPSHLCRKSGCDIDIACTAKDLIERHGRDAALVARRWADCAARAGDRNRAAAWRQIVDAVAGQHAIKRRPAPACRVLVLESHAA